MPADDRTPNSLEDYTPEQVAQMAATYQAILNNPETRELGLRATKKINPTLSIPEIDLKDQARAAFKTTNDKVVELENQIRERDARDRIRDERSKLRESGFTSDDVAAIEKIMIDEKIPSYETASRYYKQSSAPAAPAPYQGGPAVTYEMPKDALASAAKGGKGALSKYARDQAAKALDDIRAGRIKLN